MLDYVRQRLHQHLSQEITWQHSPYNQIMSKTPHCVPNNWKEQLRQQHVGYRQLIQYANQSMAIPRCTEKFVAHNTNKKEDQQLYQYLASFIKFIQSAVETASITFVYSPAYTWAQTLANGMYTDPKFAEKNAYELLQRATIGRIKEKGHFSMLAGYNPNTTKNIARMIPRMEVLMLTEQYGPFVQACVVTIMVDPHNTPFEYYAVRQKELGNKAGSLSTMIKQQIKQHGTLKGIMNTAKEAYSPIAFNSAKYNVGYWYLGLTLSSSFQPNKNASLAEKLYYGLLKSITLGGIDALISVIPDQLRAKYSAERVAGNKPAILPFIKHHLTQPNFLRNCGKALVARIPLCIVVAFQNLTNVALKSNSDTDEPEYEEVIFETNTTKEKPITHSPCELMCYEVSDSFTNISYQTRLAQQTRKDAIQWAIYGY